MALWDGFDISVFPECCGINLATSIYGDDYDDGSCNPEAEDIIAALDALDARERRAFDLFVLTEAQLGDNRQLLKDRGYTITYPGRNPNTGHPLYICFRNNFPIDKKPQAKGIIAG